MHCLPVAKIFSLANVKATQKVVSSNAQASSWVDICMKVITDRSEINSEEAK